MLCYASSVYCLLPAGTVLRCAPAGLLWLLEAFYSSIKLRSPSPSAAPPVFTFLSPSPRHVVSLMRKAPESSLKAVYKKHCSSKFGEVGRIEVPVLPEATDCC